MRYDGFGRQARWIFPSKTTPGIADQADYEQYGYDPGGNRTSLRKRDGRVIGFEYDALNRVVVKYSPDGNIRYAYDLRSLQTSAWFTASSLGVGNAYDGFGRLVSSTGNMGGFSRTVSHKYDREGGRTELAFPDSQKFWTARDGLGRATEIYQGPLGSTATIMAAFAYNAASQRSYFSRRLGDATAYGYDLAGRLAMIEEVFGLGTGNTRSDFLYNPASQLTSEARSNDSYAWRDAVTVNRAYGTANGQNQYAATVSNGTPSATFTYDANGNLTADGSSTFAYDSENRLVSATGAKNAALVYDPLGRLFQISSPATGTTQFLYDGDELVAEYNASGTLLRRYVHGDGADDPLFWYEGAALDQPRFPHVNRQGSITGTAGPGAMLLAINTYDEYGIPGAGNQGRFQYTGQAWLAELGMYYYKARIYSPTLGRFMQTDPIGYDDQINLYAYVGDDPVNWSDESGEGKVKWFVETVTGTYKRVSERIARSTAGRGGNVDAVGPGARREAGKMGKQVYGPITRHEPHPSVPATKKGHHESHVQPRVREKGQTGHVFHRSAGTAVAGAVASTLQTMGDAIGTAQDNIGPESSSMERISAKVWDFVSPASDIADTLRMGADLIRPKAQERDVCDSHSPCPNK